MTMDQRLEAIDGPDHSHSLSIPFSNTANPILNGKQREIDTDGQPKDMMPQSSANAGSNS